MKRLKQSLLATVFVTVALTAQGQSFKLINYSSWTIEYIFFSPAVEPYWGPDKLNGKVVATNGEIQLTLDAGCGLYDVKFVDADGDECIIYDVDLCSENWDIYNEDFISCEGN